MNMENIRESKEYKLAKDWEMAVNSFSFNPKRLVKECIVVMADETRHYDERNCASHEEAKCIMEYLKNNGKHIPLK